MKLHVRLKPILVERNITQKDLAAATGLRQNTISELCNESRTTINKEQLGKIAEALQITDAGELLVLS